MKVTIIYKDHNATSFQCDKIKITGKFVYYTMGHFEYAIQLTNIDYVFIDGKLEYCRMGSFTKEGK